MEHRKAKSAAKVMLTPGPRLQGLIEETSQTCARIVGATLGPGGRSVLIERQDDLPPVVTKDGVTVFRSLGFTDSMQQVVMEAMRDASVRTATAAGDGTTTCTILASALIFQLGRSGGKRPQAIISDLQRLMADVIEPLVRQKSQAVNLEEHRDLLKTVARISANGDELLAEAVIKCFELTGDEGNTTIAEANGPSEYQVEKIEGYTVGRGYEESCAKFWPEFINDSRQLVTLDKPSYLLYHGRINDIQDLLPILERVDAAFQAKEISSPNVVVFATGFAEIVLAHLAVNFKHAGTLNVYPALVPLSPMVSGQLDFLQDMRAITGGTVFDPLSAPLQDARPEQLGTGTAWEAGRWRSTALGWRDELLILERVAELHKILAQDISILDRTLVQERLAKLSGGIAKLTVVGSSHGEIRERKDRADDAVCAVRGALRHGVLPGGAWIYARLIQHLKQMYHEDGDMDGGISIWLAALQEPLTVLLDNRGLSLKKAESIREFLENPNMVLDLSGREPEFHDIETNAVLDSVPAVLEALRNAVSIAALLGTCGGIVAFPRDSAVELAEARDIQDWLRNANIEEKP